MKGSQETETERQFQPSREGERGRQMRKWLVVAVCLCVSPVYAGDVFLSLTRGNLPISDAPTNVEIIPSRDFEPTSAKTVADVIEHVPGVMVQKYGSSGALSLVTVRGFLSHQVLVVIDDVPQIPDLTGNVDLSRLTLENVERIEILRGGASAVYGPNAEGGVIHIMGFRLPSAYWTVAQDSRRHRLRSRL